MSRPSLRNPFVHPGRNVARPPLDPPSPLDPGPSRCALEPTPMIQDAMRTYMSVGVQTEPEASTMLIAASRRGSLSKLKEAGNVLRPRRMLQRFVGLWNHRRVDVSSSDGQEPPPRTDARRAEVPKAVPQRPRRPASLDPEFLELIGECFNDVASRSSSSASRGQVGLPPSQGLKNAVAFPKVATPVPVPSLHADVHEAPQPRPSRRPSAPRPSPSSASGEKGQRRKLIGVAPGSPTPPPPLQHFWTLVQRNNLHIPPERVAKWVTGGILGTGGFGRVYLVYNTTTRAQCAMKVVEHARRMSGSSCRGLINELRVLSALSAEPEVIPFLLQPYLTDYLWAWRSTTGYLHILTEVCTGGELTTYKGKLSYESLVLVCAELVCSLFVTDLGRRQCSK